MRARVNGIELEYELFGAVEAAPLVVLIAGFSQQMTGWDPMFCERLARRGFRVVRFDNRDVGLSSKIEGGPRPRISAIVGGDLSTLSYALTDMADDTARLIEALGAGAAHVVGVSMGGMIAQTLAIHHPERALVRTRIGRNFDRSFYPEGVARQLAALLGQPDRTAALAQVRAPTTVIHGAEDSLIHVSGGEATARAIPGAKLIVIPGMGHELPADVWGTVIDAVVANALESTR